MSEGKVHRILNGESSNAEPFLGNRNYYCPLYKMREGNDFYRTQGKVKFLQLSLGNGGYLWCQVPSGGRACPFQRVRVYGGQGICGGKGIWGIRYLAGRVSREGGILGMG